MVTVTVKRVGHETESVYRRYAISDETLPREGAAKLAAFHDETRNVAPRRAVSLKG